jgi:23S rRNA pseudouridine2605 synthase
VAPDQRGAPARKEIAARLPQEARPVPPFGKKPFTPRGEKPAPRGGAPERTPSRRMDERPPRREEERDSRRPTGRRDSDFSENRFPPQRGTQKPYERRPRPGDERSGPRRPDGDRPGPGTPRRGPARPPLKGRPEANQRPVPPRGRGARPDEREEGPKRPGTRSAGARQSGARQPGDRPAGARQTPSYRGIDRFKETAPPKIQKKIAANEAKSDLVRLNRYIANAGICSRRDADKLIEAGEIKVNGKVVTEMGYQVRPGDTVKYGNRVLNREKLVYVLLNKPKDFITTTEDPNDRKTVLDLVKEACEERIYPVGRLDRTTTGLLLLTNDGELADKLTHPSNEIEKIYQVEIDKPITDEHFQALRDGFELEDGFIKADEVGIVTPDAQVVGVKIHSGRNRIVRRMFEHLGYEVTKLDRTVFAGLNKKDLPRGDWRYLTEREVIRLKFLI